MSHNLHLVACFTKEVNPSLTKPPLDTNGGLVKLGLTSLVKQAINVCVEQMSLTVIAW